MENNNKDTQNTSEEVTNTALENDEEGLINAEETDTETDTDEKQKILNEIEDYKNKYLRTLAELENVKRYSSKQLEEANTYAINKFVKEILVVVDIFNKALNSVDSNSITDNTFKSFVEGISLTNQELNKIFSKFDIKKLDKEIIGEQFNPNFHEALFSQKDETKEDNTIFEVLEAGYVIKDRLLRAAKVGIINNKA